MPKKIMQYAGQAVFYGLFVAVIGYFSSAPAYEHFPKDMALIKASFSHAGQPKEECHVRTAEELANLPPNMRVAIQCGRERSPVMFDLELDGKVVYRAELPPAGLSRDGVSTVYQRFPVPTGTPDPTPPLPPPPWWRSELRCRRTFPCCQPPPHPPSSSCLGQSALSP